MNTPTNNPSPLRGEPVTGDATCRNCKYPLAGLFIGGNCPECGTTIVGDVSAPISGRAEPESLGKPLIDGPYWYLRLLSGAFWMMTIAWASAVLAVILGLFSIHVLPSMILITAIWAVGVGLTLIPRPDSIRGKRRGVPIREYPKLRTTVGLAQIPLVLVPILDLAAAHSANPGTLHALSWFCSVVAIAGIVPLMIWLSQIAEWARDAELADKLRAYGWLLAISLAGLLTVFLAMRFRAQLPIGALVAALIWLVSLGAFVLAVVLSTVSTARLISMSHWLIRNKAKLEEREIRRAEKAARDAQEHQRRTAEIGADPAGAPPIDKHLYDRVIQKHEQSEEQSTQDQDRARQQKYASEQRLEKSGDNPYGLEESD